MGACGLDVVCGSNNDADDFTFVVENKVYVQVQDENGQLIDPDELLKDNKSLLALAS